MTRHAKIFVTVVVVVVQKSVAAIVSQSLQKMWHIDAHAAPMKVAIFALVLMLKRHAHWATLVTMAVAIAPAIVAMKLTTILQEIVLATSG
jgi:hypothetical protein